MPRNKQPNYAEVDSATFQRMRKSVNKCWCKLDRKHIPPPGTKVLVRCELGGVVKTYVGLFQHGKEWASVKLNGCGAIIPASSWKTEGLTHWMTVPD